MAEKNPVEELDDDKPIIKEPDEGGGSQPPKIKSDTTDDEPDDIEPEIEPEVPVRRSVQQHIITRQQKTIKKLRSKQEDGDDDVLTDDEDDEPEDSTPPSRNVVADEVRKTVAPIVETLRGQIDDTELKELFETEPDAKAMSKQIRKYMAHPEYKGVPPAVIYHHLAFDKAIDGSVKKKNVANREANLHRNAGSSRRPKEGSSDLPDVSDMDDDEFDKLQDKARQGKFLK